MSAGWSLVDDVKDFVRSILWKCDYCGTLFTVERTCGCGANRGRRAVAPATLEPGVVVVELPSLQTQKR